MRRYSASAPATAAPAVCSSSFPLALRLDNRGLDEVIFAGSAAPKGGASGKRGAGATSATACGFTLLAAALPEDGVPHDEAVDEAEVSKEGATKVARSMHS